MQIKMWPGLKAIIHTQFYMINRRMESFEVGFVSLLLLNRIDLFSHFVVMPLQLDICFQLNQLLNIIYGRQTMQLAANVAFSILFCIINNEKPQPMNQWVCKPY